MNADDLHVIQELRDLLAMPDAKPLELITQVQALHNQVQNQLAFREQRDQLLDAAKRLRARGFFAMSRCADAETNMDLAFMRTAIDKVSA